MRQVSIKLMVIAVMTIPLGKAYGQISGTPHDLRSTLSIDQVCLPCHTPHNAQTDASGGSMILWNHEITNQTFTMYSQFAAPRPSGDNPRNQDAGNSLSGPSKLCLSCHDGVTAIDNYGGTTGGSIMMGTVNADANLGTDLRNDHPIGLQYPDSGVNTGFNDPAGFVGVKLVTVNGQARVECTSCHDPHDYSLGSSEPYLRRTLSGSILCLECHNK